MTARLVRAPPRDWRTAGSNPAPDRPPGPVAVVVPVHGAPEELGRCIETLLAGTDFARHRLVVVVDGPADAATEAHLRVLEQTVPEALSILRNTRRQGFVVSVNQGIAVFPNLDAVLLNSDTEVTPGWLDKLQAAAYSSPAVATATPFSNHATICSLPRIAVENTLPSGYSVESFAELVEQVSQRSYPRIPTGVGVCLYVKRKVLDAIGSFDERAFGLGYGEESEFCFRALAEGFVHVLDDATFIYHAGQGSFGDSRRNRVRVAHRRLRRLHPDYLPTVGRFLVEDPLAGARQRVIERLVAPRPPAPDLLRIVHVVHGWPPYSLAGTELYCRWLAEVQSGRHAVSVYARHAPTDRATGEILERQEGRIRVRLRANHFDQRNPLTRNAIYDRSLQADFRHFLAEERPDLVHVHHLSGHSLALVSEIRRAGIPWVFQLQDWWLACARANRMHRDGHLCSGPGLGKCSHCLPLTSKPPADLWNRLLYALRALAGRRVLRAADAVVMGSEFILESLRPWYDLRSRSGVHVLPYGVDLVDRLPGAGVGGAPAARMRSSASLPLRFAYVGSIMPHKGVHLAVEAFRGLGAEEARLDLWGDFTAMPHYTEHLRTLAGDAPVHFRGRFAEEQKPDILQGLDVLVVPSIGLESFGLVAREALAAGTPVVASRRSALTELVVPTACGAVFEPESSADLARLLRSLIDEPARVDAWRRRLPRVLGMAEHAAQIERVYRQILAAGAR